MYKRLLLATAVSGMLMGAAQAAPLVVGFSQIGSESGWRSAETKVSKQEAEKRGITLKIADAQQKQENQIKAVRSFIAQDVDAIFIAPVVATGWAPVLQEAKEAKIPVFLLDRMIEVNDPSLYTSAVASDSVHEGKVAGAWLVKEAAGKPCNVVELQGTVGSSVAITVALTSGTGTLSGTVTVNTDVSGKATFPGLSITGPVGNYTLGFTSAGLTGAISTTIALTPGPAAKLTITTQSPAAASFGEKIQSAAGHPDCRCRGERGSGRGRIRDRVHQLRERRQPRRSHCDHHQQLGYRELFRPQHQWERYVHPQIHLPRSDSGNLTHHSRKLTGAVSYQRPASRSTSPA